MTTVYYLLPSSHGGLPLFDDPAVGELDDAVAVGGVHLGVRDLDDGRAGGVEPLEQLHDLAPLARMEVAGGLVGEDELGPVDDGAGDGDELLLAARHLVGEEVFLADDLELVEDVGDDGLRLRTLHVAVGERDFDVLLHGQAVDEVVALEDEADVALVQLGALLVVHLVDGLTHEVVLAAPRAVEEAEDGEQRRLPRTRRPHDGDELALAHVQVYAPQDVRPPRARLVKLFEVSQFNHLLASSTNRRGFINFTR